MTCAKCFHELSNHINIDGTPKCICNGSITCRCEQFEEQFLVDFAQEIEKEKAIRRSIKARCEYILEKIPQTRNAGEKTFAKIYNEIWYGFKIRKENTVLNTEIWKRLPNQDTINREKRRCKQHNEDYKTYDPSVIRKQGLIYQALLELAIE